jgi:hypothetical protein
MNGNTDDLLYDKITAPDGTRTISQKINDQVEIEILITTKGGVETQEIKKITVTSGGPPIKTTVIVDGNTITSPPVYHDDYCYLDCG